MKNKSEILKDIKSIIEKEFLTKIIISSPINKKASSPKKIVINKIDLSGFYIYQICYFIENKVLHKNISSFDDILEEVLNIMQDNFKQCEIIANKNFTILMNRKKEFKITGIKLGNLEKVQVQKHNRNKNYVLKENEFLEWLYKLNVINKNGKVLSNMQKKFRQINKFLEVISSIEDKISENGKIIDLGCGKSYLTFALYHYLNNIKNKNVKIIGYDLKKDVIENCNKLAKDVNFKNLSFIYGDLNSLEISGNVDMVVSLHACDTATDYAIAFGVKLNSKVILSVPCCQNEISTQIKNKNLNSMLKYGIIKDKFSSLLTDSIRSDMLIICGYSSKIIEFIDLESTSKNLMIKAVKSKSSNKLKLKELEELILFFNINPKIYNLLKSHVL